jgi:competence protein ComEC
VIRHGRPLAMVAAGLALLLAGRLAPVGQPGTLGWPGGDGPPGRPALAFLDIGQGDATLITGGGRAVLVDGGPPDGPVVDELRALGVRRLDAVAFTHPSTDHAGGVADVMAALPVDALLDPQVLPDRRVTLAARVIARARHIPVVPLREGQRFAIGPWGVEVLHAGGGRTYDDQNLGSLVLRLTAGAVTVILPGDGESLVTGRLDLGPTTVFHTAHHGSGDPGLPTLLARMHPRLAVISDGRHNRYGHPHPRTLAALDAAGVPTARTDRDGTILLTVDDPAAGTISLWGRGP